MSETEKMNPDVKKLWVDRLTELGTKGQTKGWLGRADTGMRCCLGVLCDIAVEQGVIPAPVVANEFKSVNDSDRKIQILAYGRQKENSQLPDEVIAWAGLDTGNPEVKDTVASKTEPETIPLTEANDDQHYKFITIARLIDASL